ncbi:MAG: hypothetical protein RSA79_04090 [Oscillospiraceae bacterium]
MIKIFPLHESEVLKQLNQNEKTNATLAYCMYEGEKMGAYLLYNIKDMQGEIVAINSNDIQITDGLIRATISSLLDYQIDKAIFSSQLPMEDIYKLELVKQGEFSIPSIKNVLYNCKNCQKKTNN